MDMIQFTIDLQGSIYPVKCDDNIGMFIKASLCHPVHDYASMDTRLNDLHGIKSAMLQSYPGKGHSVIGYST